MIVVHANRVPIGIKIKPEYRVPHYKSPLYAYRPGDLQPQDAVVQTTDGEFLFYHGFKPVDLGVYQLHPFDRVMELCEEAQLAHYVKDPEEISEEDYYFFLESMPPCGRRGFKDGEIFYFQEALVGRIHTVFISLQGRYFKLNRIVEPYKPFDIAKEVENFIAKITP